MSAWLSECLGETELRLVVSIPEMKRREISHENAPPNIEVCLVMYISIFSLNSYSLLDM